MNWSDEAVSRLEELRGEGLHYSQIASRLGREFNDDCTGAAVQHKVHRQRRMGGIPKSGLEEWTEERTSQLVIDWNSGNGSMQVIADRLSKMPGPVLTRSAVAAKIGRLREAGVHMVAKTNGHNGTVRKSRKRKRTREQNSADGGHAIRAAKARREAKKVTLRTATSPISAKNGSEKVTLSGADGVPFIEAKLGQCRWPLWEHPNDPRHVCGAQAPLDRTYCEEHAKRARSQHQPGSGTKPARRQP